MRKTVFTNTPSSVLTVLTFRNGRSKRQNADVNGLYPQNARVLNFITSQIRMLISFHLENLSRSDIIVKEDIEKQ